MWKRRRGETKLDWRNVDWMAIVGSATIDLIGGRVAIAVRAVMKVWEQASGRDLLNENIGRELERAYDAGELPRADLVVRELALSEEDSAAAEFALFLAEAWYTSDEPDVTQFVENTVSRFWANAATLRKVLAQTIYDPDEIRLLCRDAGLDMSRISFQKDAEKQWFSALEYLRNQPPGLLLYLLFLASRRAPAQTRLQIWATT